MNAPFTLFDGLAGLLSSISGRPRQERELLAETLCAAIEFHATQRRKGGTLYAVHPAEVAAILAEAGADAETVKAGLLHDVLEDTQTPAGVLLERFGQTALSLVEAVSRGAGEERGDYNLRTLAAAQADPRVADIKLADRIANMGRASQLVFTPEKHLYHLQETEVFHLGRLAVLPGVSSQLANILRLTTEQSREDYNQRPS